MMRHLDVKILPDSCTYVCLGAVALYLLVNCGVYYSIYTIWRLCVYTVTLPLTEETRALGCKG